MMLPRNFRLRALRDFSRAYRLGRRLSSPHLRIFYLPRSAPARFGKGSGGPAQDQNFSRFGFVVSKKQAKKIVLRNRFKRILRAHIRTVLSNLRAGTDVVVQGRGPLANLPAPQICEELSELLRRADLLKK